jgi:nitroreductase
VRNSTENNITFERIGKIKRSRSKMNYEDLLELVKQRRSIHRFQTKPVPDEYIEKIIEVARWAPSGFNSQPWEFVVVRKQELKDRILEWLAEDLVKIPRMEATREPETDFLPPGGPPPGGPPPGGPPPGGMPPPGMLKGEGSPLFGMKNAPVFILLYGDFRTTKGLPMASRYDPHMTEEVFTSSLANAFLYMHLAATSLGLGSHWMSGVKTSVANCLIKELLGIPPELEVYDMMVLGYPALKPVPKFMKDTSKMIHFDVSSKKDFRTNDEVNDFIRKTRAWNMLEALPQKPDPELSD